MKHKKYWKMKVGIKFTKTEKMVNGPAIIVTETAEVDLTKIRAFTIVRNIPFIEEVLSLTEDNYYDGKLILTGKGVSKCHADDTFDEKKGYYIAQTRAAREVMKQYRDFMIRLLETLDKLFYNDLQELWASCADNVMKLNDHIKFDLK